MLEEKQWLLTEKSLKALFELLYSMDLEVTRGFFNQQTFDSHRLYYQQIRETLQFVIDVLGF